MTVINNFGLIEYINSYGKPVQIVSNTVKSVIDDDKITSNMISNCKCATINQIIEYQIVIMNHSDFDMQTTELFIHLDLSLNFLHGNFRSMGWQIINSVLENTIHLRCIHLNKGKIHILKFSTIVCRTPLSNEIKTDCKIVGLYCDHCNSSSKSYTFTKKIIPYQETPYYHFAAEINTKPNITEWKQYKHYQIQIINNGNQIIDLFFIALITSMNLAILWNTINLTKGNLMNQNFNQLLFSNLLPNDSIIVDFDAIIVNGRTNNVWIRADLVGQYNKTINKCHHTRNLKKTVMCRS